MGIMAGDALLGLDRIALVGRLEVLHVVAGDAKLLRWAHQSFRKLSYMVFMAGQTLSCGGGRVRMLGFHCLGDGLVAGEAELAALGAQQRLSI